MKMWGIWIVSLALWACNTAGTERPNLASAQARARGETIFQAKCALCHGTRADGDGVRKTGLSRRPPDFRSAEWRAGVTPEQVHDIVRHGKRGTSMPGWPALSDAETWDVIVFVLSVSEAEP